MFMADFFESLVAKVQYTVSQKKEATKLLPITFSNLDQFSKFFHCWIEDEYFQLWKASA